MDSSNHNPTIQIHKVLQPPNLHDSLRGKVALVTESSYGVGRQIAHALAHAGARVAITGRKEPDVLDTAKEISVYGPKTIGVVSNVLSKSDAKRLVQEVTSRLGPIDILVINAGAKRTLGSPDSIRDIMRIGGRNPFEISKMVLPTMQKRNKGIIIFTTSTSPNAAVTWPTKKDNSKESVTRFAEVLQLELNNEQQDGGFAVNGIEIYSLLTGEGEPESHRQVGPEVVDTESLDEIEVMKTQAKGQTAQELPTWALVFLASGKARDLRGRHLNSINEMASVVSAAE